MTAPVTEAPEDEIVDDGQEPKGDDKGEGSDADKDWQAEFKAQQKINRDIERRSKKRLGELEAQLAAATKPKADDETKPDLDAIRKEIRDETKAEALKDRVLDKIEAKAAAKFKDPEDALLRLGKNVDDFITDGKVDVVAISDALDELLTQRPDFGVTQGDTKRFQGTGDGGVRGTAGKPQLTDADVKRLYKEGKHAEIEAARKDGRLNTLLGIT